MERKKVRIQVRIFYLPGIISIKNAAGLTGYQRHMKGVTMKRIYKVLS
jgi:hypothetical protein